MLYTKIKADYLAARKSQNKVLKDLLSTFIGELTTDEKNGKTITDEVIIKKLKVYINNIDSFFDKCSEEAQAVALKEKEYLSSLIPAQLTESEIVEIIKPFTDIKSLMSYMSTNYAGRYDGKLVNRLFSK